MEAIGKYQIQRVLGRGGMGTVYEALDPLIHRKVAVKTMIPGLAESADLRARFFREAQAAGGLRHRNIVTVYDLGEDKGLPFIAMEFIEGTDLERVVHDREPLTVEWKLEVLRQICAGLGCAHRAGIVHRDVKPANIRVTHEGEVKIMDFGIAHLQSSTMTKSGLVLGTVHYMSPEQIEGHKVDHRADIFSVGAIAYELISYKRAFDGESLTGVMYKIMHERPDPAPLADTEYSPELENIVMKALARDLRDRYQSLEDMQGDIEGLIRQAPTVVPERTSPAAALLEQARGERTAGRLGEALRLAREAMKGAPGSAEAAALVLDLEKAGRSSRSADIIAEGRGLLAAGDAGAALDRAKQALAMRAEDADAQRLLRDAEAEALKARVESELAEIRAGIARAREEGQLQKALTLCRQLLDLDPEDEGIASVGAEIEAAIHEREVEQLCVLSLAYAADGEIELARKIAAKVERLSPRSPKYVELNSYLEKEEARRTVDALTSEAREHLAFGRLAEARSAAERALELDPSHALAREIRDRTAEVLATQARKAEAEAAPPAAPAEAAVPALTPLPEGEPANREAAALLEQARQLLKNREPLKALEPLDRAAALEPGHAGIRRLLASTRSEARRAEIESLTSVALDSFVQNNYPNARRAVEKALALDPKNRKALELQRILLALR